MLAAFSTTVAVVAPLPGRRATSIRIENDTSAFKRKVIARTAARTR